MEPQKEAFVQEVTELLEEIEATLLDLENCHTGDDSEETINKLFRAVHSVKGIAGMLGYDSITEFTHHVESSLDEVRKGTLAISGELITLVLKSHDMISRMVQEPPQSSSFISPECKEIIQAFHHLSGSDTEAVSTNHKEEIVQESGHENSSTIYTYRITLTLSDSVLTDKVDLHEIFSQLSEIGDCTIRPNLDSIPPLGELDPLKAYLSWEILLSTKAHYNAVCDIFIFIENSCNVLVDCIDEVSEDEEVDELDTGYKKLGEILVERGDISKEELEKTLAETSRIGDILVKKNLVKPKQVESALSEQQQVRKIRENQLSEISSQTIRVKAHKLDSLVSLVGELVTAQARLTGIATERNDLDISSVAETIQGLINSLRDETMSIRMIPIGSSLTIFKRLVRDLSSELHKDINLTISGEETELDKTVIEKLKEPLMHIIRNAIDHGIETSEERIRKGKRSMGELHISAEHVGAFVQITVQDDGAGLNLDRIREKAIERELITADAVLTKQELCQLIFAPGFSTAPKVTDLSGRGVGMDVVKRNIEALRGTIHIDTELGQGTKMVLQLPLTLAIIDGLMVEIAGMPYIIPLAMVNECMDLNGEEVEHIRGRQIINLRGKALPFIRLREALSLKGNESEREQVVITKVNRIELGLVVDKIIGGHQTVIKSLGPGMKHADHVSGATILGDGTVALILDIRKLISKEHV